MHGALRACAAATNLVQWSLRATSTGSIFTPGLTASNSLIVSFHTGSYCDSVRLAVCHCSTTGCCALVAPNAAAQASARMLRTIECFMLAPSGNRLAIQRARALGARLRPSTELAQNLEI